MTLKTWITLTVIILVAVVFVVLQIFPKKATAPTAQNLPVNPYPVLNTASTTSVTLKLGEHITVGTTILTPTEVIQDSRCAGGLQCFQAGTVILAVNASSENGADVIDLTLGKTMVQDGLSTTLTSVSPAPSAGQKINPADYIFTLNIEEATNTSVASPSEN